MWRSGWHLGRTRRLALAGALAVVAPLLVACGGDAEEPTGAESGSTASLEPFEDQPFTVGQEFWQNGFHVTLGDGLLTAEDDTSLGDVARTYVVSLEATFENLGDESATFRSETTLDSGAGFFSLSGQSELSEVPGGLTGSGSMVFIVDDGFDPATATLIVGSDGENRSEVPLGGGGVVTIEPQQFELEGGLSLELIDLELTSLDVRGDRPSNHTQVEDGKLAFTVYFDAESRNSGNWSIPANALALILPDGLAVAPESASIGSLPGSDSGVTTSGLSVTYQVDAPAEGDYTLRLTAPSWFVGADDATEATANFTVG